jgi:hypothetical protein
MITHHTWFANTLGFSSEFLHHPAFKGFDSVMVQIESLLAIGQFLYLGNFVVA